MSELFIGAVAFLVAAPVVWTVAWLALRPFLRKQGRGTAVARYMEEPMKTAPRPVPEDRPC